MLSLRASGRRVLLSGDLGDRGLRGLLAAGDDLRADAAELPHHGGFVAASPRWLARVSPAWVLQSCGPERLRADPWAGRLGGTTRLATARLGMVRLSMGEDGVAWSSFREPGPGGGR